MIDENKTFDLYGYYPSEIALHSHKKIVVVCDECGKVRTIPKYAYRSLCQNCAQKKRF